MLDAKPLLERVLARSCLRIRLALVLAAMAGIAALGLAGCGRVGPLELPPGPASTPAPNAQMSSSDGLIVPGSAQDTALKNGFDAQGNPVATTGQKKQFILDPLLQ